MFDWLLEYIMKIVPIADSLGWYMYLLVFAVAVLESTPVIGTFTPGTLILCFFGFLVSVTHLGLVPCILITTLGAMLGDYIGYLLGRYGSKFFKEHKKWFHISHLDRGKAFFEAHGGKSIFVGRFVGPIRPIVPLIAGAVRMPLSRFIPLNMMSAFVWASVLISTGAVVGKHWQKLVDALSNVDVLGVIAVGLVAMWFIIRKKFYTKKIQEVQESED